MSESKLKYQVITSYAFASLSFVLITSVFFNFTSCDAPRNNPLDPENPNNVLVSIEGTIQTFSLPRKPISNVLIYWINGNKLVMSDITGKFKIENLTAENGWLILQKEGYKPDSIFIEWQNKKQITVQSFLNEIPKLDSLIIYSIVLNQYPDIQNASLYVQAKVTDKDNDIDSVFIENQQLGVKKNLTFNITYKSYEVTLSEADLNVSNIEETIGLQFKILVKDFDGNIFNIGNDKINRVIKDEIILDSPINGEIVNSTPTLRWKRFKPGFSFTYTAEILTDDVPPVTVWKKEDINQDSISVTVSTPLPARGYFWVVWCIDQLSNKARSKPASFRVE